jgi:hypothetical protein
MKVFKPVIVALLAIMPGLGAMAQPTDAELADAMAQASFRDKWELANNLYLEKQYFQASRVYRYMLNDDPSNYNTLYHLGICLLYSPANKTEALEYLQKVPSGIQKAYDPFSHTEKAAPIDAWFYLAKAYHIKYQFDKALECYNKFINEAPGKHMLQTDAALEVKHCQNAKAMVADKRSWIIKNMGPVINSQYPDFSPVMSLDGNVLYFTSRRLWDDSTNIDARNPNDGMYFEDVYVSYKDRQGNWSQPTVLYDFCLAGRNEATISSTADGQSIYVYIDEQGDGNIWMSELLDTTFSDIMKVKGGEINTSYWETHCTLTPDGNTMYFVSDRKGGLGKRDLYRVTKLPNGEWSKALNLGPALNTPYDEDSPFIAADGTTLYFSSNGPNSMGGFDIFVTKLDPETNQWSTPVNMGYPLNTADDDVFFIQSANGLKGYYSSLHYVMDEDKGDIPAYGEKDIYEITFESTSLEDIAVLKGYLNTSDGSPLPMGIEILVYNLTDGTGPNISKPNMINNSYVLALKPCNDYRVEYQLNHNTFYETEISVPCNAGYQEIHKEIFLNALTLDGGEMTTQTTGNIDKSKIVRWKVISSPKTLTGTSIQPYDESSKPMAKVVVNQNGIFEYEKLPDQKEYLFEIQTADLGLCDEVCIALVDSTDKVIGYAKRDKLCRFKYEMFDKKWQVLYKGQPYDASGTKVTFLDENGNISFQDELGCQGMFAYQGLDAKGQRLFTIEAEEPGLCEEMQIVLLDENNKPIGETIRDARCRFIYKRTETTTDPGTAPAEAYFEKHYKYNKKGIAQEEKEFKKFMDDVVQIIKVRGKAEIEIESSASKVPTTTYKTNENLTLQRAQDAKDGITNELKKRGIDPSKLVVKAVNTQVLGPEYNDDFMQNRETYEKYQYIKIKVK